MERLRLRILSQDDAVKLVNSLNTWTDKFVLESIDGTYRVNAKSILGVLYFATERPSDIYIINLTSAGYYPEGVMNFRA